MHDYTSDIIGLADPDCEVFKVETEGNIKQVHIRSRKQAAYCSCCGRRMRSKGWHVRQVNHQILNGWLKSVLIVHQRKWHCPACGIYVYDSFSFIEKKKQTTTLMPYIILNELKDLNVTVRQVARRLNVSDTYVHETFTKYVSMERLPLSDAISIDEVYLHFDNYDNYALVIMDFRTQEIIDILPNRKQETTEYYFKHVLPKEERDKVKYLICDMYDPYISYIGKYFVNAKYVVDSFHVVSNIIRRLRYYINDVKRKYKAINEQKLNEENYKNNRDWKTKKDSRELYVLKHFDWALLQNKDDISYTWDRKYFRFLDQYLDTYDCEKLFLDLDPNFRQLRDLKERYIRFNRDHQGDPKSAEEDLNEIIKLYGASKFSMFREFAELLKTYKEGILVSFTYITVKVRASKDKILMRLSNGPMESFNNKPKDYKRNSNGVSNFDFTRNRILWSLRDDAKPLAIPRKIIRHEIPEKYKRGPYKKKKKY